MKQSKFTQSQIVSMLREYESGVAVTDICRKNSVHPKTFYGWKNKYSGMSATELKRLKELEAENTKLKKMYAELSLINYTMKDIIEKKL